MLYQQMVEEAFIDDKVKRNEAIQILGIHKVMEIEYAKQALLEDIQRGLGVIRKRVEHYYQRDTLS